MIVRISQDHDFYSCFSRSVETDEFVQYCAVDLYDRVLDASKLQLTLIFLNKVTPSISLRFIFFKKTVRRAQEIHSSFFITTREPSAVRQAISTITPE